MIECHTWLQAGDPTGRMHVILRHRGFETPSRHLCAVAVALCTARARMHAHCRICVPFAVMQFQGRTVTL